MDLPFLPISSQLAPLYEDPESLVQQQEIPLTLPQTNEERQWANEMHGLAHTLLLKADGLTQ